ncbi:MAG: hypothetical protein IPJ04_16095 [Candidatus Eisenbacteria bacterium]|nr:hypothetical protein [Candidatus Eisenbacteria bacterium]
MAGVRDVPNDQGGKVKVSWYASWLDTGSDPALAYYDVYRSVPGSVAAAAVRSGAQASSDFSAPAAGKRSFVRPASAALYAWEYVTSVVPVHFLSAYGVVVPTTGDSIAGSNPRTAFMVVGRNMDGSRYWLSSPDSGYSVDNLAPAAPSSLSGTFAQGVVALHWDPNTEGDIAGYRLYRGTSAAFVPGPATLYATPESNGWVGTAGGPYVYKLTAFDSHGNESPAATYLPGGTLDVTAGVPPAQAFFSLGSANPARAGAAATLRLGLTGAGDVSVALFDAHGRRVRDLASGPRAAGTYTLTWDGRDSQGTASAPGLYFARATGPGIAATVKIVVQE